MNQSEIEKIGIPTVTVTTTEFEALSRSTMESVGLSDMAFVIVPHPMGMIPKEEVRAKADKTFPDLMKAATAWKPQRTTIPGLGAKPYPLEVLKFKGTVQDVTKMFFDKGWSIGLPFVPPTKDLVAAMLKGTSHKPEEVVWDGIEPRMGVVTVELVAANAVMAGCKPEHMPLLLAMLEAMKKSGDWRTLTTTTYPTAPRFVISGPVVKDLGIAYGLGALGPEFPVNTCAGYFVNLIGDVAGGSRPPAGDMTTLGWQGNTIAAVVGENNDPGANPWKQSYPEEQGYKSTDNVVVYTSGPPPVVMNDHASIDPKTIALVMANTMSAAGVTRCFSLQGMVGAGSGVGAWVLSPEHASTLAHDGWTKKDLREFLWKNARLPLKVLPPMIDGKCVTTSCCPAGFPKDFLAQGPVTPDTLIPVSVKPDDIDIFVIGGAGKQSQWWSYTFGPTKPVIVKIDPWK